MKKIASYLLAFLVLFNCNTTSVFAQEKSYINLISSPDCEDITDYTYLSLDSDIKHSGTGSFKFSPAARWTHYVEQKAVNLEALKSYYFSAWIKTEKPLTGLKMYLGASYKIEGDETTKYALEIEMVYFTLKETTDWQRVSGTFTVNKKRVGDDKNVDIVPDDVLINQKIWISASTVPTNSEFPVNINVDDMELRELADSSEQATNLINTSPANNAEDIAPYSEVVFEYDNLIDKWSVLPENVVINGMKVDGVTTNTVIDEAENTSKIIIKYSNSWIPKYKNTVSISNIKNIWGNDTGETYSVSFNTTDLVGVVGEFYCVDNDSEVLIDSISGENICGKFYLNSMTGTDIETSVILALCKGQHIERIYVSDKQTLPADGSVVDFVSDNISIPNDGDYYLKAFIWTDIEGILSMADTVEFH